MSHHRLRQFTRLVRRTPRNPPGHLRNLKGRGLPRRLLRPPRALLL